MSKRWTVRAPLLMSLAVAGLVSGASTGQAASLQAGTTTARPSDDTIEDRIEQRLDASPSLKPFGVDVAVEDGVVTLTGTVATTAERARAAQLAKINGVVRVDNRIDVRADAPRTKIDRAANKTKKGLDKAVDAVATAGKKSKDAVQTGIGKSEEGTSKAANKTAEGVAKAGNKLSDASVTTAVKTKFSGEELLNGSDISVSTTDRVVTLTGTVPSIAARERAVQLARGLDSVDRVVDELRVAE